MRLISYAIVNLAVPVLRNNQYTNALEVTNALSNVYL